MTQARSWRRAKDDGFPFGKSVALVMESNDQKDREFLEELLSWHFRINGKKNYGFIVGAFVDLLIGLAATSCSDPTSYSYAVSIKKIL